MWKITSHYIKFHFSNESYQHITLCLCTLHYVYVHFNRIQAGKKLEKTTFIKNKNYSDLCCLYLIKINKTEKLEAPVNEAFWGRTEGAKRREEEVVIPINFIHM